MDHKVDDRNDITAELDEFVLIVSTATAGELFLAAAIKSVVKDEVADGGATIKARKKLDDTAHIVAEATAEVDITDFLREPAKSVEELARVGGVVLLTTFVAGDAVGTLAANLVLLPDPVVVASYEFKRAADDALDGVVVDGESGTGVRGETSGRGGGGNGGFAVTGLADGLGEEAEGGVPAVAGTVGDIYATAGGTGVVAFFVVPVSGRRVAVSGWAAVAGES